MPAMVSILLAVGVQSVVLGSITYLLIKLVGYSIAGIMLNSSMDRDHNVLKIGAVRTLLGLVLGSLYVALAYHITEHRAVFLLFLVPIRYLEWWIIVRCFYRRNEKLGRHENLTIAGMILFSFVLDLPAIFGVILIGGFWVC